ncbi:tRNA(Met) cytidine acetyltransferase TmcA [Halocatena pleomorpha]|uniref:tRNA(Met) cytidine acetyltransferase TmcA n=1 Tax=Halocatena pleomorpha TaxID=1785090 RepID=A0A3P3R6Z5_9EURY|nr:tRNA(Met) cytidine acetyltransferase TmcA [Halocatena pleomorpha]RRJ29206.1 tRNA(Met) cytidine acetyltransferase [Halocatena pleomorpha]
MLGELVDTLLAEARRANERRLLVLTGSHESTLDAATTVVSAADFDDAVLVGHQSAERLDRYSPTQVTTLLGTTHDCIVIDAHEECRPNTIGRVAGAVDGGGLFVLLTPPLDSWVDRRDQFDATLAVPPDDVADVTGRFRRRLVSLLRRHDGIAIVDLTTQTVVHEGTTDPSPTTTAVQPQPPPNHAFPAAAYQACLTTDQARTLRTLERLREPGCATVVETDRGRGKSSAAGLAAGSLAATGRRVLVTAPAVTGTTAVFARARELCEQLDVLSETTETDLRTTTGGRVYFEPPDSATALPNDPDAVVVDEAAALPVGLLERFLTSTPVVFTTTIHGYEGAGRGFSVRFRDRLEDSALDVTECTMDTPIRYAPTDPIERWAFHTLLLDARPVVDQLVTDARPDTVDYERPTPAGLLDDEHQLRELFGLLVLAHYRTEPDDLARVLDAPNLSVRTLTHDGHVVAVALLAREGGLASETRRAAYRGERLQGNMLPDLLTGQLRDPEATKPIGQRVMRIATHPAVRSRGLGTRLLESIHAEFDADWFGVAYGATPELIRFWNRNGYRMVHLSTTRNETSGEHSAVMLRSGSSGLYDRHADWFRARIGGMLTDTLSGVDPDVVRAALRATDTAITADLTDREWRLVASAAYGPGQFDMHPEPFRRLALTALSDQACDSLSSRQERLLVTRVLQARPWSAVATALDFHSSSGCRRALGRTLRPLVDQYGTSAAQDERSWYDE